MSISISNLEIFERKVKERMAKYKPVLFEATKIESQRVKARTQQGKGLDTSFLGYSPSWAKVRQNHTPPLRTDIVDLTFSGDMFNSMQTTLATEGETRAVATVEFNGAFNNLKASVNNKSRPFFGFSKEQIGIILNKLKLTK